MGRKSTLKKEKSGFIEAASGMDNMPEDGNHDIWHLMLHFEQEGEKYHCGSSGRPKIYALLSSRIEASGIQKKDNHWITTVADMITRFWGYELEVGKSDYAIEEFVRLDVFNHLLGYITGEQAAQQRMDTGKWVTEPDVQKQPSKRTEKELELLKITKKVYTEEELEVMFSRFRKENK